MPRCVDPKLRYVTSSGYKWVHFSLASPLVKALPHTPFNCETCIYCRKRKSTELAMRCVLHASLYKQNCFLTLTYDEKRKGYDNEFRYSDIQNFKKRLRQYVARKNAVRIEIFNVHEYGKNGKKHWHLVVFGWTPEYVTKHSDNGGHPLFLSPVLRRLWPFGFHTVGSVTEASAMYQAQYTQKDFQYGNANNSKKSHSKHSGIGKPFFLRNYEQILRLGFVPFGSRKAPIPRYFLKLAKRHWAHFYEPSLFFDNKERKAQFRPFKKEKPNREIADLYSSYMERRSEFVKELEAEWDEYLDSRLFDKSVPEFRQSGENALYDLRNKIGKDSF